MSTRWKLYSLTGTAVAAEVVAYLLWRPRMLRWGATAGEASEPLPGDDRTPRPRVQSTRAVTIGAPPERVWPWLAQMGIGRAGFYTHDWVERLIAHARYVEGRHSATRIHPEIPPLAAGDTVPMGAGAFAPVSEVEPYRHLVAQETYVLRPLPGNKTRLIARYCGAGFVSPGAHAIRLTDLAERYGAPSGSVTDIYLPRWFAHNMPAIHTPLLVLMTYLHARNLRRSRRAPRTDSAGATGHGVSRRAW
jgi:hypothetical protein